MSVLAELPAGLRALADPDVGIVPFLEECMAGPDEPRLARFSCELADGIETIGADLGHTSGLGGAGRTQVDAAAAAIGEAVERYSASALPADRLVLATAGELGPAAVPAETFALFAESQHRQAGFPFARPTPELRLRWVDGIDLETGELAWLPAELVYLSDVVGPGEPRLAYSTSSGLACAGSRDRALASGLLELLERDAFMLTWALRLAPSRLALGGRDDLGRLDARLFAPTGVEYAALDLSRFHRVPTVLGVVRAPGSIGALGVGSAAAPEIGRAWLKALAEAFACRSAARRLALVDERRLEPEELTSFEDHIRFYADADRAATADFLLASDETTEAADVEPLGASGNDLVELLVSRIRAAGSRCYAVDVTAPDVRDAGLCVIRTLAPALCPLDVVQRARFLGCPRYWDMASRDPLTAHIRTEDDLNPDPHPFP